MTDFIIRIFTTEGIIVEYTITEALGAFDAEDKALRKFRTFGMNAEIDHWTIQAKV